jgi:hypothetical protein
MGFATEGAWAWAGSVDKGTSEFGTRELDGSVAQPDGRGLHLEHIRPRRVEVGRLRGILREWLAGRTRRKVEAASRSNPNQ